MARLINGPWDMTTLDSGSSVNLFVYECVERNARRETGK
jgi:hypothetical protein